MTEHRAIMAALLEGNRQVAASLMHIHLRVSRDETFIHMDDDLALLRGGRVRLTDEDGSRYAGDDEM